MSGPVILGDQRAEQSRNKALKSDRAKADEGVRYVMNDANGRAYMAELLRDSATLQPIVSGSEQGVMFREGQRVMGFKIMEDVRRAAPQFYAALIAAVTTEPKNGDKDGN